MHGGSPLSTPIPVYIYIYHSLNHHTHTQLGVILQKLSQIDLNKSRDILRQLKKYGSHDKWLYRLM